MPTLFLGLIPRYVVALISNLSQSVRTDISVPFSLKLAMSRKLSDAVITTATEQKSSQQPPRLQQPQNQPTPSGNPSVPSSLSPLAFKIAPFCLSPCSEPLIWCKFCFQTCHELLSECLWVSASGLTLGQCLRPQVTEYLVLKWICQEKARPSPMRGRGDKCLPLDWRQWCQGSCPSSLRSLTPMDAQINVPPPSWLKIPLSSLPPVLGCEQCWATKKKPLPSFLSVPVPITPPLKRAVVVSYQLCLLGPHLNLPQVLSWRMEAPLKHKLDELKTRSCLALYPGTQPRAWNIACTQKTTCWVNS